MFYCINQLPHLHVTSVVTNVLRFRLLTLFQLYSKIKPHKWSKSNTVLNKLFYTQKWIYFMDLSIFIEKRNKIILPVFQAGRKKFDECQSCRFLNCFSYVSPLYVKLLSLLLILAVKQFTRLKNRIIIVFRLKYLVIYIIHYYKYWVNRLGRMSGITWVGSLSNKVLSKLISKVPGYRRQHFSAIIVFYEWLKRFSITYIQYSRE